MFDLSTLDVKTPAETGTEVQFNNPYTKELLVDDEGKPYWIKIMGGDSGKVSRALRQIADRRVEALRANSKKFITSEESRQEDFETMAAATLSWYLPPIDGAELACTEENALKLYSDPRFPWIMEKLEKVIADRRAFFKKNSTT